MSNLHIQVKNNYHQSESKAIKSVLTQIGSGESHALANRTTFFTGIVASAREVALTGSYMDASAQVTRTIHESLVGEPGVEAAGKSRTTPQVFCEQLDITTVPSELLVEEIKNILTEHQDSPLETEQLTDVVKRLSVLGINEEPALGLSVAIFILGSRNFKDWETTRATMTSDGLISSAGVTPEALTVWQKQYSRMNKGYHDEASTSLEAGFYYPSSHEK